MASQSFLPSHQPFFPPLPRKFVLRKSPVDSNVTLVHPHDYSKDAPPFYSVENVPTAKCNIRIYQGYPDPRGMIGESRTHGLSLKNGISLRGQTMRMKMGQFSGDFTIQNPHMGDLKWVVKQLTGSSMQLSDASGTKLAKLSRTGSFFSGEKKLEIFVPCDAYFCELVVLTAIVAKITTDIVTEVAGEAAGAAAGA